MMPARPNAAAAIAFDGLAPTYHHFTQSVIGSHLRDAVQRRLEARYRPGQRLLEINCGTGVDAAWLAARGISVVATDVSPGMLAVAHDTVQAAGVSSLVTLRHLATEEIDGSVGTFDGLLSNFGGLNCVASMEDVAPRLAACVRPGGIAMLCVMGPHVPWEWLWHLARFAPGVAFRRLRRDGVAWRGVRVRYPSIGALTRAWRPWFVRRRVAAIGCLIPPTYTEPWARRHARLIAAFARLERRVETLRPLPDLADHYLIELERTTVHHEAVEGRPA